MFYTLNFTVSDIIFSENGFDSPRSTHPKSLSNGHAPGSSSEVETLRNEVTLLRQELKKCRETISKLQEREKSLRER